MTSSVDRSITKCELMAYLINYKCLIMAYLIINKPMFIVNIIQLNRIIDPSLIRY